MKVVGLWPTAAPRPLSDEFSIAVPFETAAIVNSTFRTAVILHIFHAELADELRKYCAHIPGSPDVFITTDTAAKQGRIEKAFANWDGKVQVQVFPNRGRDIAPKLLAYSEHYSDYELLLFLHSKKSTTGTMGNAWRTQILECLSGSGLVVESIFTLFASDSTLGMVAPKNFEKIQPLMKWGDPRGPRALAEKMGVTIDFHQPIDFPAGSMFWARPEAIGPLLELGLELEDFPAEAGQVMDTPAHAIERLFFFACEQAGYTWCKVAAPAYCEDRMPVMPVATKQDLEKARNASFQPVTANVFPKDQD